MNDPAQTKMQLTQIQRRELISVMYALGLQANGGAPPTAAQVGALAVLPDDELVEAVRGYEAGGDKRAIEILTRLGLSERVYTVFMPVNSEGEESGPKFVALRLSPATLAQYLSAYVSVRDLPQFASVSVRLERPAELIPAEPQTDCEGRAVIRHDLRERCQVSFAFDQSRPGKFDRRVATGVIQLELLEQGLRANVGVGNDEVYVFCTPEEVLAAQSDAPVRRIPRERDVA